MSPLERLEKHFGKPLESILSENHLLDGTPMARICNEAGVTRQTILRIIAARGLRVMSRQEIEKHIDRSGPNSAWFGRKNPAASLRMRRNNPNDMPGARESAARTIAKRFKKNLLPQEKRFAAIAKRVGLRLEPQVPLGRYVVDFLLGTKCIEIDSTDKWDLKRKAAAAKKDSWLRDNGFHVIRINKRWLSDSKRIREILLTHNLVANEKLIDP